MKKEKENLRKYLSAKNPDNIQGKLIPGSDTPYQLLFYN